MHLSTAPVSTGTRILLRPRRRNRRPHLLPLLRRPPRLRHLTHPLTHLPLWCLPLLRLYTALCMMAKFGRVARTKQNLRLQLHSLRRQSLLRGLLLLLHGTTASKICSKLSWRPSRTTNRSRVCSVIRPSSYIWDSRWKCEGGFQLTWSHHFFFLHRTWVLYYPFLYLLSVHILFSLAWLFDFLCSGPYSLFIPFCLPCPRMHLSFC